MTGATTSPRRKIIIKFDADISELDALRFVFDVVRDGRISNDGRQFCYATAIHTEEGYFDVVTDLTTTGTDVFAVFRRGGGDDFRNPLG